MLTQCPSCQTTFRVTSEILRVAHGQVRCGRCQTQFDALERLIEESDAGEIQSGRYLRPPPSQPEPPAPADEIEVEEPAAHEDITLEGRHIEITGTYRVLDQSGHGQAQVREEVIEEWVEIDDLDGLRDDREQSDELVASDEDAAEEAGEIEVDESEDNDAAQAYAHASRAGSTRSDAADFDLLPRRQRAAAPAIWTLAAAGLVLLLVLQLAHSHRFTLARHPVLGPPLIGLYGFFGLTLRPDWNLHAYEILQWHVGSDPTTPGTLRVRASIKNLAPFAQPYPLLKLVLEDRWGEQVRAREFEPAEYLDPTTAPDRLLAPAQQANATINIVDPGPDAEGFRFDVCLRGAAGPVCAADVPSVR
jgi:predicted Zn finger-like uncharacterized protein